MELLAQLDTFRRDADRSGKMEAMDSFSQKAVEVITSGRLGDALDVGKESPEVLRRYIGTDAHRDGTHRGYLFSTNRNFLLARRLIEAGVRCVAISWGGWDTHEDNFRGLRTQLPAFDMGLSALIEDLDQRGMLQDVAIVVWGEFGRTPKINAKAGRDHWTAVAAAFLAGGGLRVGQVLGASDRHAAEPLTPIHVHQVHATLYHTLGIDARTTQLIDPSGRPQYLLENGEPLKELI